MRNGTWGLLGGLALFAIGFLFFEGVIGISGERLPLASWVLPAAVIAIGDRSPRSRAAGARRVEGALGPHRGRRKSVRLAPYP